MKPLRLQMIPLPMRVDNDIKTILPIHLIFFGYCFYIENMFCQTTKDKNRHLHSFTTNTV